MNATSHVDRRKNQLPTTPARRSMSHIRRARGTSESMSWRISSTRSPAPGSAAKADRVLDS